MDTKNQAPSSEELQQQSFDAWVEAMELEHFKQQRLSLIHISEPTRPY